MSGNALIEMSKKLRFLAQRKNKKMGRYQIKGIVPFFLCAGGLKALNAKITPIGN
jgi:hypothetical protein